jgi:hypothetical protein
MMCLAFALGSQRPAIIAAGAGNAPFVVDWTLDEADAGPQDGECLSTGGHCTLRAAIQQANSNSGPDTIILGANFYFLFLPGSETSGAAGDLNITGELTIRGAGMHNTTLVMDSNLDQRVLEVSASATVRLEQLGLTGGAIEALGGGIANAGNLTLDHTRVFSNGASVDGGGYAGGIYNSGWLSVIESLVDYNYARTYGAGLYNIGATWIEASTIANNRTHPTNGNGIGGGIYNSGSLYLVNSTLSGNRSMDGGSGLHNSATGLTNAYNLTAAMNIHNTDLDESDTNDAGVANATGGTLNVRNSLITRNYELIGDLRYYNDCGGSLGVYGNNYFMPEGFYSPPGSGVAPCLFTGTGIAFITMAPSDIYLLADNGGVTPTHDIDPSSPAYDGGESNYGCPGPAGYLATDQRNTPRVHGVRCDAGAVEHGSLWELFAPLIER